RRPAGYAREIPCGTSLVTPYPRTHREHAVRHTRLPSRASHYDYRHCIPGTGRYHRAARDCTGACSILWSTSMTAIKTGVLAALALGAATSVAAADFSYSTVDAGWARTDIDDLNENGDGFFLRGSVGFGTNWFAAAGYRQV